MDTPLRLLAVVLVLIFSTCSVIFYNTRRSLARARYASYRVEKRIKERERRETLQKISFQGSLLSLAALAVFLVELN